MDRRKKKAYRRPPLERGGPLSLVSPPSRFFSVLTRRRQLLQARLDEAFEVACECVTRRGRRNERVGEGCEEGGGEV